MAALLAIAGRAKTNPPKSSGEEAWVLVDDNQSPGLAPDNSDLNKLELWIEIQKQIKILREGMENEASMQCKTF